MSGMGKQNRAKARKHAVDMSPSDELDILPWTRPPADELLHDDEYHCAIGDAPDSERLIVRVVRHVVTYQMVVFAMVQQTFVRGRWVEVAEADSCHDTDCHVHQCGKRANGRTGDPTVLMEIGTLDNVEVAYSTALEHMNDQWRVHRDRWEHG